MELKPDLGDYRSTNAGFLYGISRSAKGIVKVAYPGRRS